MTAHSNQIRLHEGVWKSEINGFSNWTNLSVIIGEPTDLCFQLTGLPRAELEINEITGGLGIKTAIKNMGPVDAIDVTWEIEISGGFLLKPDGGMASGGPIDIATEQQINTFIIGFGGFIRPLNITILAVADNANPVSVTVPAKVLLFFVLI